MDNRLEQDALIEDALQNYPLAPMPRDITASCHGAHPNHARAASVPGHME